MVQMRAQLRQHRLDHMVAADQQARRLDLAGGVAVADVPGKAGQVAQHLDQRFLGGDDLHAGAVGQLEPPPVVKAGDRGQVDHEGVPAFGLQPFAADQAFVIVQHHAVMRLGGRVAQQLANGGKVGHPGYSLAAWWRGKGSPRARDLTCRPAC